MASFDIPLLQDKMTDMFHRIVALEHENKQLRMDVSELKRVVEFLKTEYNQHLKDHERDAE